MISDSKPGYGQLVTGFDLVDNTELYEMESALKRNNIGRVKGILKTGYDVNCQNETGNTALHIALANDNSYEILQVLLQHGASCKIRNRKNISPLQCIKQESTGTIENLLILENSFDLTDEDGNNCLHTVLMFKRRYIKDTMKFWKMVARLHRKIKIDFNKQNAYGNTILMTTSNAACLPGVCEHLQFILENLPDIDVFKTNKDGDNFLHILSRTINMETNSKFIEMVLKGCFRNCPKEALKELTSSKNNVHDTPFLQFLQSTNNILNTDMIHLYLDAGSSVNDTNIRRENALHRAVLRSEGEFSYEEENYAKNILCLAKAGADVNALDMTSSTPIMLVNKEDTIHALIGAGSSVNKPNKLGQTPLVLKLLGDEINLNALDVLIAKGADVNAVDIHNNSVLHYIAWERVNEDVLLPFLEAGAHLTKDTFGQLPCHVAYYRKNQQIFERLCQCSTDTHIEIEKNFHLKSTSRNIDTIALLQICDLENRFQRYQLKSDLLHLADIGHVSFDNEAKEIKLFVHNLVGRICDLFGQKNPLLNLCIVESGSAGENTKVQNPNEFDFVCILQKLSEMCEVNEDLSSSNPGYAYLKLKDEIKEERNGPELLKYFDSELNFDTFLVWQKCQSLLQDILHFEDLFRHPNVVIKTDHRTPTNSIFTPTCKIKFCWSGPFYKHLEVEIDLTLACQIKGWWPEGVELDKLPDHIKQKLESEGCLLLLQTQHDEYKNQLRISAMNAEKTFVEWLPKIIRDSYVICKIMCDDRICPGIDNGDDIFVCREYITSYELKTCAFQVFRECLENKSIQFLDDYNETELHEFVCKILIRLKHAISQEHLESFLFPWQNVLTFLSPWGGGMASMGVMEKDDDNDNFLHVNCSLKLLFLVAMLQFLGVHQDQNEVDIERIKRHWKKLTIPMRDKYFYWKIIGTYCNKYQPKTMDSNNFYYYIINVDLP